MTIAVVAEKPSVARDIARVLGARKSDDGVLTGGGYAVTWAVGHLVALAQPHAINPVWKAWRRENLPMLPQQWLLTVLDKTRERFDAVSRLMNDADTECVVCATDAGREGELIFRYIYEKARCTKPVKRLWISSLTPEAIKQGFGTLREGREYDALGEAARGRSQADWLVGMNLSRAYTIAQGDTFSVGRVQTPTLAMIVERTNAINAFVPEDYFEVRAWFSIHEGGYEGVYCVNETPARLPADGAKAKEVAERGRSGRAEVLSIGKETKRQPPPLLYDLTELQRHANRLYGFSATRTLEIAQSLYERHKVLSYPRSDSRHLTRDVAATMGDIVDTIKGPYEVLLAPGTGERPLSRRFVDDARVSDHHAIIPTTVRASNLQPNSDEARIYDLVCRRVLSAWHGDYVASTTTVMTAITSPRAGAGEAPAEDLYRSSGTLVDNRGWRVLDPPSRKKKGDDGDEQQLPAGIVVGVEPIVRDVKPIEKRTKPPAPYTEATLLTAMETAGKTLDDKELTDAMKANGLGTPATRAAIIETLIARGYIVRKGKALSATPKGMHLIGIVHEHVKSPAMTGVWESRLKGIEKGKEQLPAFMRDIEDYVRSVVGEVAAAGTRSPHSPLRRENSPAPEGAARPVSRTRTAIQRPHGPSASSAGDTGGSAAGFGPIRIGTAGDGAAREPDARTVTGRAGSLEDILHSAFGFRDFRPHQREVCEAVVAGRDCLLVMPTGAGKSLCYQLPGLARQGTTLVISPLIALMEDQVAVLKARGMRAERIHSGRGREDSRAVCRQYLDGSLDFLFIAPERLGVPGFPEMLARRKPVLIAVDEAHCISHWGHDFRPDYRMLHDRMTLFRPTPVIAMTATATPTVQRDIAAQLGLGSPAMFIHGFRRTNIAIEVAEIPPSVRPDTVAKILLGKDRVPAIVYAPTRKKAEELAAHLAAQLRAAAYHAGMSAATRDEVQSDFLADRLDVIVATIAFGMGIDKADIRTVVHAALPGSVEGYYQEIGRAGRDGKMSRAVLMHSWADTRTHEFFQERDYPDPKFLQQLYDVLDGEAQPKEAVLRKSGLADEVFDTCLEKLWIHGGARIDPDENVTRGPSAWRDPYLEQGRHRRKLLADINAFAGSHECRMLRLVRHFGDQEDSGKACGQCDVCEPGASLTLSTRSMSATETKLARRILASLDADSGQAKGKMFRDEFERMTDRREFESVVRALVQARLIRVTEESFSREGEVINFQRLHLRSEGRVALRCDDGERVDIRMEVVPASKARTRSRRKKPGATEKAGSTGRRRAKEPAAPVASAEWSVTAEALRAWRLGRARKTRVPAFRILTDRTLLRIAEARPRDEEGLLAVPGMGPALVKKYGAEILKTCRAG